MVRRILIPAVLALLLATGVAHAEGFLAEVEDLPLAPGLTEQPGGTLFEGPTGRIVQATAGGTIDPAKVRVFYADALPGLGWKAGPDLSFTREDEILRIDVTAALVRFSITPAKEGTK